MYGGVVQLEKLIFDSAVIVFSFYMIACIVKTTVKTCCLISLIRSLEVVSTDFIKNKLPEILKDKKNHSSHVCCGCCCKDDICSTSIGNIQDLYAKVPELKDE